MALQLRVGLGRRRYWTYRRRTTTPQLRTKYLDAIELQRALYGPYTAVSFILHAKQHNGDTVRTPQSVKTARITSSLPTRLVYAD